MTRNQNHRKQSGPDVIEIVPSEFSEHYVAIPSTLLTPSEPHHSILIWLSSSMLVEELAGADE